MRYNLLASALNKLGVFIGTSGEVCQHKLCSECLKRYCIILCIKICAFLFLIGQDNESKSQVTYLHVCVIILSNLSSNSR